MNEISSQIDGPLRQSRLHAPVAVAFYAFEKHNLAESVVAKWKGPELIMYVRFLRSGVVLPSENTCSLV